MIKNVLARNSEFSQIQFVFSFEEKRRVIIELCALLIKTAIEPFFNSVESPPIVAICVFLLRVY